MQPHPAANLFPLLPDAELAVLAADIKERGLLEPVTTLDGHVLDGRNRLRACELAGVSPRFVEWEGRGDPVPWVVSKNLKRRHLTESQRGMVAARTKDYYAGLAKERQREGAEQTNAKLGRDTGSANWREPSLLPPPPAPERPALADKGKAADKAAADLNVSPRTVERAAKVVREGTPALVEAVDRGTLPASTASEVATLPAPKQDDLVARVTAASSPAEARKAAREILKSERDEKRKQTEARRMAELEERVKDAPAAPPSVDIRLADVLDVVATVKGAALVHADPPWQYRNEGVNGAADGHYDTNAMAGIVAALDAAYDAAADDAYLLMWATFPMRDEWEEARIDAKRAGRFRWRYVSGGAWGKTGRPGAGFHWRGDAEELLLFAKGNPRPMPGVLSNFHASERTEHSEKPKGWLRECVEHFALPSGPVLDLWAGRAPLARVCAALGRAYVGAELDKQRHKAAVLLLRSAA